MTNIIALGGTLWRFTCACLSPDGLLSLAGWLLLTVQASGQGGGRLEAEVQQFFLVSLTHQPFLNGNTDNASKDFKL